MYAEDLRNRPRVTFEQCRAASGWSVPSHASMLTGKLPHQHGVHVYNCDFSTIPENETFLSELDYTKYGVSANVWASSQFGFDIHFDEYIDILPYMRFSDGIDVRAFMHENNDAGKSKYLYFLFKCLKHEYPIHSIGNGVYAKLDSILSAAPIPKPTDDGATEICSKIRDFASRGTEPFFLFANFMDAHGPMHDIAGFDRTIHSVPSDWRSTDFWEINKGRDFEEYRKDIQYYRQLYAASVAYLDKKVDTVVSDIQDQTEREVTVIVTADHGENLGYKADDRVVGHRGTMSEALLHVPLCIYNPPDGFDETIKDFVSHLSLGELIKAIAADEAIDIGMDRVPAERIGSRVPETLTREQYEYWNRMERCVYVDERKVSWDSRGEKREYELQPNRPSWQRMRNKDVTIGEFESTLFDKSLEEYRALAKRKRDHNEINRETKERLEELGYV